MVDLIPLPIWSAFVFAWWILLPAYAANAFALLSKYLKAQPIDQGMKLKKHRILGKGKTIEGFVIGLAAGTAVGIAETLLYPDINLYATSFGVSLPAMSFFIGFMIAFGALAGDAIGSFIKRRMNLKRGAKFSIIDKLDFVIGAILFSYWFTDISVLMIVIMIIMTPLLHKVTNIIGYTLKIKKEPW